MIIQEFLFEVRIEMNEFDHRMFSAAALSSSGKGLNNEDL